MALSKIHSVALPSAYRSALGQCVCLCFIGQLGAVTVCYHHPRDMSESYWRGQKKCLCVCVFLSAFCHSFFLSFLFFFFLAPFLCFYLSTSTPLFYTVSQYFCTIATYYQYVCKHSVMLTHTRSICRYSFAGHHLSLFTQV